jgi:hypothetical protein
MGTRHEPDAVRWTSALGTLYPLSGSQLDRDGIANVMDHASGVSGEMIVLTESRRLSPAISQHLLDQDLLELFLSASQIILGAYDGEGYVRWTRPPAA